MSEVTLHRRRHMTAVSIIVTFTLCQHLSLSRSLSLALSLARSLALSTARSLSVCQSVSVWFNTKISTRNLM